MFIDRFEFLKKKYKDRDSHKLRSKFNSIEKLLVKLKEIRKNEDWNASEVIESQIYDIMSELEYLNYFENLLLCRISDNNIDRKLPNSNKDFDIFLTSEEFNVWIDVKNLSNIEERHNITVSEYDMENSRVKITNGVSDPSKTAERLQKKLLDKISEKLAGINPEDFHDPVIIALSPYTAHLINHITPVIEAIQSPLKYNTVIKGLIPEDSDFDPFQKSPKERMLFTGVFYSEFYSDQHGNFDLNVIYLPHFKAINEFPHMLLKKMKTYAEKRGFNPKIIPSKVQFWKIKEESNER